MNPYKNRIEGFSAYDFPADVVVLTKSALIHISEQISSREKEESGTSASLSRYTQERFAYYKQWCVHALKEYEPFGLEFDDLYLYDLVQHCAGHFAYPVPAFIAYLFYEAREAVRKQEAPFGAILPHLRVWTQFLELQFGKFTTEQYAVGYEDIGELFRTPDFLMKYRKNETFDGQTFQEYVENLEKKIGPREEISTLLKKERNTRWKTYKDLCGGILSRSFQKVMETLAPFFILAFSLLFLSSMAPIVLPFAPSFRVSPASLSLVMIVFLFFLIVCKGIKGYIALLYNCFWVMIVPFLCGFCSIFLAYLPTEGKTYGEQMILVGTGSILLVLGMALLWFFLYRCTRTDSKWRPIPPGKGLRRAHWSLEEKREIIRLACFWTVLLGVKAVWNYWVFVKWLKPPTEVLWLEGVEWWAIFLFWLPFIFFFFLDTFGFFYIGVALVSFGIGERLGVNRIKNWKEFGEHFKRAQEKFYDKLLPLEIQGENWKEEEKKEEKREEWKRKKRVAWAKTWNEIVKKLYEEDKLTWEEKEDCSYRILETNEENYLEGEVKDDPKFQSPPENLEARERLFHFLGTLFMEMPSPKNWEELRSLTVMTPIGPDETIGYSWKEYTQKSDIGKSMLGELRLLYRDEWDNFVDRMERQGIVTKHVQEILKKKAPDLFAAVDGANRLGERIAQLGRYENGVPSVDFDRLSEEILQWAGCRLQEFSRTARGLSYQREALLHFAKICFPAEESQKREERVDEKFHFLVGCQAYESRGYEKNTESMKSIVGHYPWIEISHWKMEKGAFICAWPHGEGLLTALKKITKETRGKDIPGLDRLVKESFDRANRFPIYPDFSFAPNETGKWIFKTGNMRYWLEETENGLDIYATKHSQIFHSRDGERSLEFRANPLIGEGKPCNQNSLLRVVKTEICQTIDVNQDGYFEEWLKTPNILKEFDDPDVYIVGMPERIFTASYGWQGWVNAFSDRTFVTMVQRFLNWAGIRMHYGHPDYFRGSCIKWLGGVGSPTYLSEDVVAGYNVIESGGRIRYREYLQAGKGREVSYVTASKLFTKFGMGAGQQLIKRHLHRLNSFPSGFGKWGWLKAFTYFFGALGFFLNMAITKLAIWVYLLCIVLMGMSSFVNFPNVGLIGLIFGIASLLSNQSITILGIYGMIQEKGYRKGMGSYLYYFPGLVVTYMSHIFNISFGFQKSMEGKASYEGTGRGPMLRYLPFQELYNRDSCKCSLFPHTLLMTMSIFYGIWIWRTDTLLWSLPFILTPVIGIWAPFVFCNRGSLRILSKYFGMAAAIALIAILFYTQSFKGNIPFLELFLLLAVLGMTLMALSSFHIFKPLDIVWEWICRAFLFGTVFIPLVWIVMEFYSFLFSRRS